MCACACACECVTETVCVCVFVFVFVHFIRVYIVHILSLTVLFLSAVQLSQGSNGKEASSQTSADCPYQGNDAISLLRCEMYWLRREVEKKIKECQGVCVRACCV